MGNLARLPTCNNRPGHEIPDTPIEVDGFPKAKSFTPDELKALGFNLDQCGFATVEEEILPPKELIEKYQAEREAQEAMLDEALKNILALIENKGA